MNVEPAHRMRDEGFSALLRGVMLYVIEQCQPVDLVATYGLTDSHMQLVAQVCTQQGTSPSHT